MVIYALHIWRRGKYDKNQQHMCIEECLKLGLKETSRGQSTLLHWSAAGSTVNKMLFVFLSPFVCDSSMQNCCLIILLCVWAKPITCTEFKSLYLSYWLCSNYFRSCLQFVRFFLILTSLLTCMQLFHLQMNSQF